MKGSLIVIIGPSTSGKTELVSRLLNRIPNSARLKTTTTRKPRVGEGDDYFFIDKAEFEKGIQEDEFFEYAEVYGNLYGSSKKVLGDFLDKYKYVFAIADIKGARTIKSKMNDAHLIFIRPGSIEDVRRRMIKERSGIPPEELQSRLNTAILEMSLAETFDTVVDNIDGKFDETVDKVVEILMK